MNLFQSQSVSLIKCARNGRIALGDFRRMLPWMSKSIVSDRGSPCLDVWGASRNFDEFEKAQITDPKLLNVIGREARAPMRLGQGYHAGLLHTYGYLLSTLKTRFGLKHERWTSGAIERGLGLPVPTFFKPDSEHSFLQTVTVFLLNVISPRTKLPFAADAALVAPAILHFDYDRLRTKAICENVYCNGLSFSLFTHVVAFRTAAPENHSLVIYTAVDDAGNDRLYTCFPISKDGVDQLLAPERFGAGQLIRARFNASLPGFPSDGAIGKRVLEEG